MGVRFDASHRDFVEWLVYSRTRLNDEALSYIAAIIYGIWYSRNLLIFEHKEIEETSIIEIVSKWLDEYKKVNIKDLHAVNRNGSRQNNSRLHVNQTHHQKNKTKNIQWRKPTQGTIKINSDANLAIDDRWGLSAICRDAEGELLAAAT
ncbi:hypothetical protein TSUD_174120 [Trifolium subterraneum]|nr:hypothetical protein TSUD_174120 [Trifolium subterraneum]